MSFLNSAKKSLIWTTVDTLSLKLISFITSVFLIRMLSPDDFGLVGLIFIFIAIGGILVDSGMGSSLIREKDIDDIDYSTVFYANLGVSIGLYLIIFFLAPIVSIYYKREILTGLLRLYGLSYIVSALFITQQSKMIKNLNFKSLALLNIPSTIVSGIIAITMAYLNFGVWSIVVLSLSNQVIKVILIWWYSDWRPSLSFSIEKLSYHFDYGYKLILTGIMGVCTREIYALVIGKKFDISSVGYYTRAKSMKDYPVSFLGGIINKITFPLISKIKEDKNRVSKIYQTILKSSFLVMTLIMTTLIVVAKPLFVFLFTDKWIDSAVIFQILALVGILTPVHSFNLNIFKIYGRTDILLKLSLIKNILVWISIPIGLFYGLSGLLWGAVIISLISFLINSRASSDMIGYSSWEQIKDMFPVAIAAFIAYGISSYSVFNLAHLPSLAIIMIGVLIFNGLFITTIAIIKRKLLIDTYQFALKLYNS